MAAATFTEFGNQMYESVRIESLNILDRRCTIEELILSTSHIEREYSPRYADPAFQESLVNTLNATTVQMDRMVKRFREQKEMVIVAGPISTKSSTALNKRRRDLHDSD
jgi:hypothetical protein